MEYKVSQILTSLQAVNDEITEIKKDQQGHGYKFRGINQVLNTLSPLFKKHHILTKRKNISLKREIRVGVDKYDKPKTSVETFIEKATYVFVSTLDGSEFETEGFGEGIDQSGGDKSSSMATSNSYKYVIFELFNIATEEQKDSDQVTAEEAKKEEKSNVLSGFRKKKEEVNGKSSSVKEKEVESSDDL